MPAVGDLIWFAVALAGAGAVAGLLAGLFGIGGGAILVPVFYQLFGLLHVDDAVRMHLSVGTSLAIIVPTSIRSFLAHRKRGAVDQDLLRSWLLPVPLGVFSAAVVAASVSSAGLRAIFALIAILVGVRMLLNRQHWRLGSALPSNPVRALVGWLIGLLSGLMGIGGGVLNNTFMTLYGSPVHRAVATSAGVGVLIAIPGLFGYIWAGWGGWWPTAVFDRLHQLGGRGTDYPDHACGGAAGCSLCPCAEQAATGDRVRDLHAFGRSAVPLQPELTVKFRRSAPSSVATRRRLRQCQDQKLARNCASVATVSKLIEVLPFMIVSRGSGAPLSRS